MIKAILKEIRDWLEYLIIPAISVILPWTVTVKFFWLVARVPWLYRNTTMHCLIGAKYLNLVEPLSETEWIRCCKVGQMIDLADAFLILFRGKKFINKYITENISEQLLQQQIIFTPHFGAGMFVYKLLQINGIKVTLIGNDFARNWRAASLISRLRLYALTKSGTTVIWNSNMIKVREVLHQKQTIIILPDVPDSYGWDTIRVETGRAELNVAMRYFHLAEKRQIPVMNVISDIDVKNGYRQFEAVLQPSADARTYAQSFAEQAVLAIVNHTHLWRMLVIAPQVLSLQGETEKK